MLPVNSKAKSWSPAIATIDGIRNPVHIVRSGIGGAVAVSVKGSEVSAGGANTDKAHGQYSCDYSNYLFHDSTSKVLV